MMPKVAENGENAVIENLNLAERILYFALDDIGREGMTGEAIDAIEAWIRRAEIILATLALAEDGRVVAFVREDGTVAFRCPGLPGVGGRPENTPAAPRSEVAE